MELYTHIEPVLAAFGNRLSVPDEAPKEWDFIVLFYKWSYEGYEGAPYISFAEHVYHWIANDKYDVFFYKLKNIESEIHVALKKARRAYSTGGIDGARSEIKQLFDLVPLGD